MFKPEDFELPLEKQLRLRVINAEIDQCDDAKVLGENLKECAKSLMSYQHLLGKAVEKNLMDMLDNWEVK
tara:strand:- start:84 stop:293 length:210 start_codon:yes stop_codon:yes gene_type:complete